MKLRSEMNTLRTSEDRFIRLLPDERFRLLINDDDDDDVDDV